MARPPSLQNCRSGTLGMTCWSACLYHLLDQGRKSRRTSQVRFVAQQQLVNQRSIHSSLRVWQFVFVILTTFRRTLERGHVVFFKQTRLYVMCSQTVPSSCFFRQRAGKVFRLIIAKTDRFCNVFGRREQGRDERRCKDPRNRMTPFPSPFPPFPPSLPPSPELPWHRPLLSLGLFSEYLLTRFL